MTKLPSDLVASQNDLIEYTVGNYRFESSEYNVNPIAKYSYVGFTNDSDIIVYLEDSLTITNFVETFQAQNIEYENVTVDDSAVIKAQFSGSPYVKYVWSINDIVVAVDSYNDDLALVREYLAKYPSDLVADETYSCTDTDGGINESIKGSVTGIWDFYTITNETNLTLLTSTHTDSCRYNEGTINELPAAVGEYYCDADNRKAETLISCANGCVDGACVVSSSYWLTAIIGVDNFDASSYNNDTMSLRNNNAVDIDILNVTYGTQMVLIDSPLTVLKGQSQTINSEFACANETQGSNISDDLTVVFEDKKTGAMYTFVGEQPLETVCQGYPDPLPSGSGSSS